jgi:hypothetical protein
MAYARFMAQLSSLAAFQFTWKLSNDSLTLINWTITWEVLAFKHFLSPLMVYPLL